LAWIEAVKQRITNNQFSITNCWRLQKLLSTKVTKDHEELLLCLIAFVVLRGPSGPFVVPAVAFHGARLSRFAMVAATRTNVAPRNW